MLKSPAKIDSSKYLRDKIYFFYKNNFII